MNKIIELVKYIFLSIIQGVGEVLPISSSGHLMIARKLLGINSEGIALELILHLASLVALFIYYRKTITSLMKGFFYYVFKKEKEYERDFRFIKGMIISLIPTCLAGYFLDDYLDGFLKYSFVIGIFLILNGINLYTIKNKENVRKIEELNAFSFMKIGLGQCFGLIPGFSRSGSCLSMCYREKMDKEDSEKFTFLMLFPLVLGSVILNIGDFSFNRGEGVLLAISFILTFIITMLSIRFLNRLIKNNKLYYFSYYCVFVGILVMFI